MTEEIELTALQELTEFDHVTIEDNHKIVIDVNFAIERVWRFFFGFTVFLFTIPLFGFLVLLFQNDTLGKVYTAIASLVLLLVATFFYTLLRFTDIVYVFDFQKQQFLKRRRFFGLEKYTLLSSLSDISAVVAHTFTSEVTSEGVSHKHHNYELVIVLKAGDTFKMFNSGKHADTGNVNGLARLLRDILKIQAYMTQDTPPQKIAQWL